MSQPNQMLHARVYTTLTHHRHRLERRCHWAQPQSPCHHPIIFYKLPRSLLLTQTRNTTAPQRNVVVSTHCSISSSAPHSHRRLKMFHPYILGAFFASVLGFLLYALRDKERKDNRPRHHRADGLVTSSSEIGQCRQDDGFGTDIIIVGAGVAGSALAHTLGKVTFCPFGSVCFARGFISFYFIFP